VALVPVVQPFPVVKLVWFLAFLLWTTTKTGEMTAVFLIRILCMAEFTPATKSHKER